MVTIGPVDKASPTVRFYSYFNVESQDPPNNRSLIRVEVQAFNTGTSSSSFAGAGNQVAYFNGYEQIRHSANPFLPAVAAGAQRWLDGVSFWIAHDGNGQYNGGQPVPISMLLQYGSINESHPGSIVIPSLATLPPAPSPLDLTEITDTSMKYRFSGNGTGGGTFLRWEYQYSTDPNFATGFVSDPITSTGTSVQGGLTKRTPYYFRSRCVNTYGPSPWSTVIGASTIDLPDKPPTPGLISRTTTQLVIDTTDPAYIGGSLLDRLTELSLNSNFSPVLATSPLYDPTFTGLLRGTAYYSRFSVHNTIGWSPLSDTFATTTDITVPAAPTAYGVTDLTSTTAYSTMPTISDNGGGQLNDLRVEYNTSQSSTGSTVVTVGKYAPAFMENLTPGTNYFMRMAVANSKGFSAYGTWVPFTTKNNVPTPPINLTISGVAETQATATWTPPTNLLGSQIVSYTLRVAEDPSFTVHKKEFTLAPTVLTQLMEGLTPAQAHFAQVWANSTNGVGSYSAVIGFTTTGTPIGSGASEWRKINGVWRHGTPWRKINGVWRSGRKWRRINGTWKSGI